MDLRLIFQGFELLKKSIFCIFFFEMIKYRLDPSQKIYHTINKEAAWKRLTFNWNFELDQDLPVSLQIRFVWIKLEKKFTFFHIFSLFIKSCNSLKSHSLSILHFYHYSHIALISIRTENVKIRHLPRT